MKTNKTDVAGCCAVALLVVLASAPAGAATEGESDNFFGTGAGANNSGYNFNSFFGGAAGAYNTTGYENTFLGNTAGYPTPPVTSTPSSEIMPAGTTPPAAATSSSATLRGIAKPAPTSSTSITATTVLAPPPSSTANSTIICSTSTARSASRLTAPRSRNCISRSMAATWAAGSPRCWTTTSLSPRGQPMTPPPAAGSRSRPTARP